MPFRNAPNLGGKSLAIRVCSFLGCLQELAAAGGGSGGGGGSDSSNCSSRYSGESYPENFDRSEAD